MDVIKAINSVRNLNSFISLTRDFANKNELSQIPLNMSTILALKKISTFEFEFFSKCQERGLAFMILDRLLRLPPSKTWGLLGKELMPVLLYWLESLWEYLIDHCQNWWIFLKSLLKFIKDLSQKCDSVSTALVEYLAEPLLRLCCSEQLSLLQRLGVLRCLNHCSAFGARATRLALADKLAGYFTKIAHRMARCEHVPTQLAITELLLRWLPQRHERGAREAAARRWLPAAYYGPPAVAIFIQRSFQNFYRDAREFLNAHNETGDVVTSVLCRKMDVGRLTVISGTEQFETWLDVNSAHGCVSVHLDRRIMLKPLNIPDPPRHETLTVPANITVAVQLSRASTEVVILLKTSQAPEVLFESTSQVLFASTNQVLKGLYEIRAHVSSRCDVARLDRALQMAFEEKYQCLLEVDSAEIISQTPPQDFDASFEKFSASEDDTRFSISNYNPKNVAKKRKLAGHAAVRIRKVSGHNTPSTASTTSLAQLHEKLESLPRVPYVKEPPSVCVPPELSLVDELSEPEDLVPGQRRTRAIGVPVRRRVKARSNHSDEADATPQRRRDGQEATPQGRRCYISSVHSDHDIPSCLYVATVGSIDDSVINDSLEQTRGRDIIDLLAREALVKNYSPAKGLCVVGDSGISTAEVAKTIEGDTVEVNAVILNTPMCPVETRKLTLSNKGSKCTIVSKSTSDESNTEAVIAHAAIKPYVPANKVQKRMETSDDSYPDGISETPRNFVTIRRRNFKKTSNGNLDAAAIEEASAFNIDEIEGFFSQHFRESSDGNLMISPTLARKINESSSDTNESFDRYLTLNEVAGPETEFDINLADIKDCLSDMIDNVCQQIDKCNEFMEKQDTVLETLQEEATIPVKAKPAKVTRGTPKIKLLSKGTAKKEPKKRVTKKGKLQLEPLVEKEPEVVEKVPGDRNKENYIAEERQSYSNTPLLQRRKRKLYSPKDIPICADVENDTDQDDAIPLAELKTKSNLYTPEQKGQRKKARDSAATSYKDIETERQKHTNPTRNRKSKVTTPVLSPKTKKNNSLFDKLKDNINNGDLRIVDKISSNIDIAVYNYTSDSEDEDFKKKKIVDMRRSGTKLCTLCSNDSVSTKGRALSKVKYTESSPAEAKASKKSAKKGPTRQRRQRKPKLSATKGKKAIAIPKEIVDERMRDAKEREIDTSLVIEETTEKRVQKCVEIEPVINCVQEMEQMEEVVLEEQAKTEVPANKFGNNEDSKKNSELSLKKNRKNSNRIYTKLTEEHRDESPLPALIIEKTAARLDDDVRSTTSSNLIKKCNRLIENGDEFLNDTVATQNMLSDADNLGPEIKDCSVEIKLRDKLNVFKHKEIQKDKKKQKVPALVAVKLKIDDYMPNITEKVSKKDKNQLHNTFVENLDLATSDSTQYDIFETKGAKPTTYKRKLKLSAIETINLSNHNGVSSITMETNGSSPIRCDSANSPPKTNELTKAIAPRNMELEQLSPSMHDYFLQLRTEITEAPRVGCILDMENLHEVSGVAKHNQSASGSSPVVCLKKLTDDEYRKWLPSPKSSFNADPPESIEKPPVLTVKGKKELKHGSNFCCKTAKEKKQNVVAIVQSPKSVASPKIDTIGIKDSVKMKAGDKKKAHAKPSKKNNPKQKEAKADVEGKRLSGISPIHLSDNNDGYDEEIINSVQETPNYLKKITEIFSQTKTKITTKKYNPTRVAMADSTEEVSEIVKECSRTSNESLRMPQGKKRSLSPKTSLSKCRKVQTEATSIASSVSSVKEWFARMPAKSAAEDVHSQCRDCIENVLEKLDTTLIEIHQDTSRKLVNMFVDFEAHQTALEARRAELFAASARETLTETVRLVSGLLEKQNDGLNDTYKQLDKEFKEKTRRQAADLVREDCRQKRAMVTILREDVQAVMDQLSSTRRDHLSTSHGHHTARGPPGQSA